MLLLLLLPRPTVAATSVDGEMDVSPLSAHTGRINKNGVPKEEAQDDALSDGVSVVQDEILVDGGMDVSLLTRVV